MIDPGHSHNVTDAGHGHAYSDSGHNHTVNDPGHSHDPQSYRVVITGNNPIGSGGGTGTGILNPEQTTISGTGVYLSGSYTYITILGSVTGISVNQSGTGITLQNTGSGAAVNILNPYRAVSYCIKT